MLVHPSRTQEYVDKGYVKIGDKHNWVHLENPEHTCLKEMRGGKKCLLDKDHNGVHSSVVFYCDPCGKTRRGYPSNVGLDPDGAVDINICFFCDREHERNAWKGKY